VTVGDANLLGIRERLGVGTSNFKGSPKNRRHNIATGAAKLNGIIIPQGEEFSLVKALGEIDETTGYLPELVIKGDRTIPEFGGGLCQIGTTVFRAALAAGFPILERQSHSYRVRYYEPAGTDATIYPPKPDFRFKNDTPAAVVLFTRIEGDDLFFEFWGTSDGRKAARTDPKIFNITKPPAMKTIETEDLPPGKKKCTEVAHDGADTVFTYTVTMADGSKREQVFRSHYKPWQAVCLIGVEKKKEEPQTGTPSLELPPPPDVPRQTQ
jgi:vancomycin resistance protein YoaR